MVITIDGPAGAGKSTVARQLAQRLGFDFLDTGAMYRSVAWLTLEKSIHETDENGFDELAQTIEIEIRQSRIWINGLDVTSRIRSAEVTNRVSAVADNVSIRRQLATQQREIAKTGNFVCEGRDQGTLVFPESKCKFFLTASDQERARRRATELRDRGEPNVDEQRILHEQIDRDQRDMARSVGGLRKADDAIEFVTDGMTCDEVVDQLERLARDRLGLVSANSPDWQSRQN